MTREQFLAQCSLLYSQITGTDTPAASAAAPTSVGRAPKYETRCRVRDGYKLSSEMDADDLAWWADNMAKRALEPNQYQAKNQKDAKYLAQWRDWRRANPNTAWTGERNHQAVTVPAPVPGAHAPVHEWEPRGAAAAPSGAAFADEPDDAPIAGGDEYEGDGFSDLA